MDTLFWSDEPAIDVVRAVEPWVQELRSQILSNLERGSQPLHAYLERYDILS